MMLLYFAAVHLQDVLLLEHGFRCNQAQVLLVSVKSEESMIECEAKWLE